jgi:hypothetical protein
MRRLLLLAPALLTIIAATPRFIPVQTCNWVRVLIVVVSVVALNFRKTAPRSSMNNDLLSLSFLTISRSSHRSLEKSVSERKKRFVHKVITQAHPSLRPSIVSKGYTDSSLTTDSRKRLLFHTIISSCTIEDIVLFFTLLEVQHHYNLYYHTSQQQQQQQQPKT